MAPAGSLNLKFCVQRRVHSREEQEQAMKIPAERKKAQMMTKPKQRAIAKAVKSKCKPTQRNAITSNKRRCRTRALRLHTLPERMTANTADAALALSPRPKCSSRDILHTRVPWIIEKTPSNHAFFFNLQQWSQQAHADEQAQRNNGVRVSNTKVTISLPRYAV